MDDDDLRGHLASLPPPPPPSAVDLSIEGPLTYDETDEDQITYVKGGALHVSFILQPGYRVTNEGARDHWIEEPGSCLLDAEISLS